MGHELCHCFGMKHCTKFNCVMMGSNHAAEAGRKFHELCPMCLQKIFYAVEFDPLERYEKLKEWIDRLIWENPNLHIPASVSASTSTPSSSSSSPPPREVNYFHPVFAQWSAWYGRRIEAIKQGKGGPLEYQEL